MGGVALDGILYRLDERPRGTVFVLSTLQWLVFILANVITVPVVLGPAFGMNPHDVALYTERTFFVCGLIGVLQAIFGHRYGIIEGPAGMWWGVCIVLINMARDVGTSMASLQSSLEMGLIISGIVFVLFALFRVIDWVRRLFTPVVTGTFLVLLSLQVSKSLIEGILGIGFHGSTRVLPHIALLSVCLIAFTIGLMVKGRGLIKNLAVLIGLVVGWVLFALFGLVDLPNTYAPVVAWPQVFPFGPPHLNVGITITCVITSVILLSNLIASIQAFALVSGENPSSSVYQRGTLVTGIGTLLSGVFGTVGAVPLTAAASLVSLTGIASRLPFVIASAGVAVLGFFPNIGQWVATLPSSVGYAILFTVFGQLLGFGLRDYKGLELSQRDFFVVSPAILTGVGILFVPGTAWLGLPKILGYILDNGLIVGVLLVLFLEHVVFRQPKKDSV
jgi:xanthine/uracil permease